ncbi:hypothetical protein KC19_8G176000 [Ceratodon purpureus]|uniref:Protein kinase domain-containing protein n=1 Tax=Ceratodon purpureus TaxID=3225 RepID=A0A8T0H386_CERPU|nr:hypothetical protein KC19_8G176000 [Ceratodon purpureus]
MGHSCTTRVFLATAMVITLLFQFGVAQAQDGFQLSLNESSAMHLLYKEWSNATPDFQSHLPGWGYNSSPCDPSHPWQGVRCLWKEWSNDSTRGDIYIVSLRMINSNLVGTLPPSIGMLQSLVTISIQESPRLVGVLDELGNLQSVNSLKIFGTGVSGRVPLTIASSTFLQTLDLSRNKLDGEIAGSLLDVPPGLQKVNMSWNKFGGALQQNMFLNKKSLSQVDFSNNHFNGSLPNFSPSVTLIDFSNNSFSGVLPNFTQLQSIDFLNLSTNQLVGVINPTSVFNTTIGATKLDLSYNKFNGSLPNLEFMTNLQILNLSYNNFDVGSFPLWTVNLTNLKSLSLNGNNINGSLDVSKLGSTLQQLDLKFNNISNVHYNGLVKGVKTVIRLQGNPYCVHSPNTDLKRCVCEQDCMDTEQDLNNNIKTIIITVVICGVLLAIIITISATLFWKTKREQQYLLLEVQQKFLQYDVKPTLFTFHELQVATKNFHSSMILGEGSFGVVYKGILSNGNHIAIKQLFNMDAQKDIDDFLNEVVLLTSVKHRNLVNLKGCCLHKDQRWLLYEYVENYDIAQVLFDHKDGLFLNWSQRLNICLGVAHGLHYLHALSQPSIIHRDIKASNVLLDTTFNAKIADFGLALLFPDEQSHVTTTHVAGSRGYLAPEYATMGQVSAKTDVYSFGVLMLEIISGRRNIDFNLPRDKIYLSKWAWKLHIEDNLMELVDSTLTLTQIEELEIKRVINIALLCSQRLSENRPTMAQVVAMIQGNTDIESEVANSLVDREGEDTLSYDHVAMDGSNLNLISIPEDSSVRMFHGPLSSTIDLD